MKKKDKERIEELSAVIGGVLRYHKPETIAEVAEAICAAGYCRYEDAAIKVLEKLGRSVNKSRAENMYKANETPSEDLYIVYRAKAAEDFAILNEINFKRSKFIEKRIKANECAGVENTDG